MIVSLYETLSHREAVFMEKLLTRKEAADYLGISLTQLDEARRQKLIAYVQYVQNV